MAGILKNLFSTDRLTGLKRVKIDATVAGPGNSTLVAAVTGKRIRVYAVVLSNNAAVLTTVKFQSGTGGTDITGPLEMAASGGGFSAPFSPVGHFETADGALLNLNIDVAATVGGWLVYAEV